MQNNKCLEITGFSGELRPPAPAIARNLLHLDTLKS